MKFVCVCASLSIEWESKLLLGNASAVQQRGKQLYDQENKARLEKSKEDIMLDVWAFDEFRNATELVGK